MSTRSRAMFRGSAGTYRDDPTAPLRRAGARGDIGLWAWGRDSYPGARLEPNVLPGLLSTGLWEVTADQDWGLDWHLNEGIEVTFVTGGRVGFSCEDEDHDLQSGWVTLTRPWQRHRIGRPTVTACTLGWFLLDVGAVRPNQGWQWPAWLPLPTDDLARLTELLRHQERPVWRASIGLTRATERLERALRAEGSRTLARVALGIADVLLELTDVVEQQEPQLDPYLLSTQRMVEVFLAALASRLDEPWTIDAMAAECGLGRTRFVHHCRQTVNVTPLEHLTALRVEKALELLSTTDLSVADVAFSCGFQSSQYFAVVFRRHFGRTPSQARDSARSETDMTPWNP